ncbi:thiol reductant ABC exporter subunit CydD [Pelagibacterium luteolum]|uniref:ATP-binding cassette, subfamily C, CydD n=1 Tax=Pelagibacterium luteolum TaxID=440168 RepID=A0A1G7V1F3_9HYPH|nr:thiol reductant ABC exporter subunit CydD [Pelagibacterium luteolum]SDG52780.1 ATP-binding cassette, subfamily C, CydD [Pelagibacterium luteolum]
MSHSAKPTRDTENTRKLMGLRRRGGRALTLAIAAPLLSGVLLVAYAALLSQVLGRAIEGNESLPTLLPMIIGMIVIVATRAALGTLGEWAGQIGAERIKASLRGEMFERLLTHRHGLGIRPASGAISAALVDQVEGLENFFAKYIPAMIAAAVLPVAFAVLLFPVDWVVALLFLLTAPLIPVFMALAGLGAQAATDRQATALSRLSAHFADRLRGLTTLKLFGREADATRDVHTASEALRTRTNAVLRIAFLSSAILEFFAALGVAGVALYVGLTYLGFLTIHAELTLVAGLFALIMAPEVYNPLRQLAAHYHDRASAKSALSEIERQIGALIVSDLTPSGNQSPLSPDEPLKIKDLHVTSQDGQIVLDNLDLIVAPGETVAIMGPSGVGKSTLARATLRLLPSNGDIFYRGISLGDWPEAELRRSTTYIAQKPGIFAGTIFDNIAFANPDAEAIDIKRAADLAHVSDFTRMLPDGLQTYVGEGGMGLSGGQIQRVGLARLFLTAPDLVILDEPTAHLDPETEALVLDNIFAFAEGRALVILTHADAVSRRADRILRMAGGKLIRTPHRRKPDRAKAGERA